MKIAIVAPCHIPPTADWISSLQREAKLGNAEVIIVDDSDGKLGELPAEWNVCDYKIQEQFLGDAYAEFARMFHKCSACRIFGHVWAYRMGFDVVIGLDSDCVVPFHFVQTHLAKLNTRGGYGMMNPLSGSNLYSRGYPYFMRNWKIVANMGMWDNVLDLNGKDRHANEPKRISAPGSAVAAAPLPFSGMNFALTREALPGFLFLPNFKYQAEEFRRIDDVWGGYIFQLLARKRREATIFGAPVVFHDTVVIAQEDADEEAAMYKWEENFIKAVDAAMAFNVIGGEPSYPYLFEIFLKQFSSVPHPEFEELIPAMDWWVSLWKEELKSK